MPKTCISFEDNLRSRQDILRLCGEAEGAPFVNIDMAIRRHIRNGAKVDAHPNSVLLGKQIINHENIVKFLSTDSSAITRDEMDIYALSDLMGLEALTGDMPREPFFLGQQYYSSDVESQPSLSYPSNELYFQRALFDMGNNTFNEAVFTSEETDGHKSSIGARTVVLDPFPVTTEFNSTQWDKHSLVVPYFERKKSRVARAGDHRSSLTLETLAPMKSPGKTKGKQPPKKKRTGRSEREKDMYSNNFVLACESLLSIIINKKQHDNTTIQSLKKSGAEMPQVLTHISASIAGTGIAVLFSVICKVVCSSTPLCSSKILSTGLGLGLVWFSWAVNGLRDTIIYISKRSSNLVKKEEDMMKVLDNSVNEIYFRAATLLAVLVLRLA
ncbi:hypothetical protein Leryth_000612 [Lithospermum erythrorhizon]|nr:hypothetical protein Leryth_000612 [Lithospermum erythrorhizon]